MMKATLISLSLSFILTLWVSECRAQSWLPPSTIVIDESMIGDVNPGGVPFDNSQPPSPWNFNTDEITEETFGAYLYPNGAINSSRGNIFFVNTTVNLWEHLFHLDIATPVPLCFFVYQGANLTGTYNLVDSVTYDSVGRGNQFYSSGVRNLEMRNGLFYYIGVSWLGHIQYARGGSVPPIPCSFGSFQTGTSNVYTGFPPAPRIENSNSGIQAYHQTIRTGYPAHPSAPWSPANFILAHNDSILQASLSWVNPRTTVSGDTLTELMGVRVIRDGIQIATVTNVQIGQPSACEDSAIASPDFYGYTLVPYNTYGDGLSVSDSIWIGLDTPGPPQNLLSFADSSGALLCSLVWLPPDSGAHGGFWYPGAWDGVIIHRNSREIADLTGNPTTFIDTLSAAGWYLYRVTYYNSSGMGQPLNAPWVYAGWIPTGSFDIGGGNNDFPDIISAVSIINNIGVNGPLVFNVYPRTYDGQITLRSIYYTSPTNTVTFNGIPRASGEKPLIVNTTGAGYNEGNGFYLRGVRYITIRGFEFQHCDYSGIYTTYGYNNYDSSANLTIENNYFNTPNSAYAQLYLYNTNGAVIRGNEFNGCSHGMRIRYSSECKVVNNMLYGQDRYGIYTYNPGSSEILFNSIYSPGSFEDSRTLYIAGPTAYNAIVKNNIIYNYGISGVAVYYLEHPSESDYNCIYAPDCNLGFANFANQRTLAEFQAATGMDAHSISENPEFQAATNLHIQPLSPCVLAATPITGVYNDFDGDMRNRATPCIGCDETSVLALSMTPHNPPVVIPPGGGSFRFDAEIVNISDSAIVFDAWTEVILPNGMIFGPLINRTGITIPAYSILSRTVAQNVPGVAPPGVYTYVGKVGTYPDIVNGFGEFPFEILAGEGSGEGRGWTVSGWFGDYEPLTSPHTEIPMEFALQKPVPNPFNSTALIGFALPQSAKVTLVVFDIGGREVARLADGWYESGYHQAVFTGDKFASGVYFARISAGNFQKTVKLLLLK